MSGAVQVIPGAAPIDSSFWMSTPSGFTGNRFFFKTPKYPGIR